MHRPLGNLFLLLALPAAFSADPRQGETLPPVPTAAPPVMVIDGEPVDVGEFGEWILRLEGENFARASMHEHWMVAREAERRGVRVEGRAVDAEIDRLLGERIAGAFHGRREGWLAELARTGRTENGIRLQRRVEVRDRLDAAALASIDRVVPRAKVEREWWLRYGRNGRKYDLGLIQFGVWVETPESGDRDLRKAEETRQRELRLADARHVRELLLAGADFGQLAQEHSTDPETRDRRGRPAGSFDPQGWPVAFLDELEKLAPGQISEPLYARGGWWIVQVRGVTVTPLSEVEAGLAAELLARGPEDDEIEAVRRRLSDGVAVKILPELHAPPVDAELHGSDVPALSLGGETVTRGEYARWMLDIWGEVYARTYAEDVLVQRKAAAAGIAVSEEEVLARARQQIQDIIDKDFLRNRQRWYESLTRSQRTEEQFLRRLCHRLRVNLLVEKLIQKELRVDDARLRQHFEGTYADGGVRREVSMILVSSRYEDLDHDQDRETLARREAEALEQARLRALSIVTRARGGADFAELARAESDDLRTQAAGGALPGRFRADQFPDAVARAVEALEPGAISEPIPRGPTWLVFRMRSVRRVVFEDVREELQREFSTARPGIVDIQVYRNELAQKAQLEFVPPPLR